MSAKNPSSLAGPGLLCISLSPFPLSFCMVSKVNPLSQRKPVNDHWIFVCPHKYSQALSRVFVQNAKKHEKINKIAQVTKSKINDNDLRDPQLSLVISVFL